MNDKISVIVPVYKTEKFLDKCVQSIVSQTYKNLEIILVDDGSPDNCPQMCDAWAKKDERIKVLHIPNAGVANARNTALKKASGSLIVFADSDDYLEPEMYQKLYELLVNSNADISVCDYQINDEDKGQENINIFTSKEALKRIALGDYKYGVLWNKLYRKNIVESLEMPSLKCSQDLPYNFFAFRRANVIAETSLKLYHYYQNENSTVHGSFNLGAFDAVKSKEIILNEVKDTDIEPFAVRGLISSCFVVLSGAIKSNEFEKEINHLKNIILSYKKTIFSSNLYASNERIRTAIIAFSFKLYCKIIRSRSK